MTSSNLFYSSRTKAALRGAAVVVGLTCVANSAWARPSIAQANLDGAVGWVQQCITDGDECNGPLSQLEQAIRHAERDEPGLELGKYKALLARRDEIRESGRRWNLVDYLARDLRHFVERTSFSDCIQSPSGCDSVHGGIDKDDLEARIESLSRPAPNPVLQRRLDKAKAACAELAPEIDSFCGRAATTAQELLESTRRFRKNSLVTAVGLLDRSAEALRACQRISPNNAALTAPLAAVAQLRAEFDTALEKVYTGPWHKQHVGKVLLASQLPEAGKESPAMFKSSFKAGEPIYGIAYLRGAAGELSGDVGQTVAVMVQLTVAGRDLDSAGYFVAPEEPAYKDAWANFEVMPEDPGQVRELNVAADLSKALAGLEPGKHTVSVTVWVMNNDNSKGQIVADGTFEYDASAGQGAATSIATSLADRVLDEVRMPEASMKDAKLQKQMLAAAADNEFGDVPLRVVILDDVFEYERAFLTGVILSRTIHTAVATKGKDGTCMVRYIQMTQQAVGKRFDPPLASMPSDESTIRCENVNK
jgi:hypothetical protein